VNGLTPKLASAEGAQPSAEAIPFKGSPVLEVRALHKRYGGVHALRGADLRLTRPGTVHCLIGENGSGKSTLLNVLSGQVRADSGAVLLDGRRAEFASSPDAVRAGIAMVSQETAVAPHLSIAENILLGERLIGRRGWIDWTRTRRRAAEVLARLDLDYDVTLEVSRLKPDQRQMVEIARALSIDARVLILDEPTSFLSDDEVERTFAAVRRLSENGVSTIFVSHRLPELFAIADEVTVLRDGRTVSTGRIDAYDADRLIHDMIGTANKSTRATRTHHSAVAVGHPRLRATGLAGEGAIRSVDLEVAPGEIVGVAGLAGSGRSELLEMLFGALPLAAGEVAVDGRKLDRIEPKTVIAAGVGFVPAERKTDGLVLTMSVRDNLGMAKSARRAWWRRPKSGRTDAELDRTIAALRIKTKDPYARVDTLSGGNQQKVALGKWLVNTPTLLLLEEPTRGVDVRAKSEIHDLLRDLAQEGVGLLISSSENEELLGLCDRVLVMYQGRVVVSLPATEASEAQIARFAGGTEQ
jgi:ABC-type sugar transport system ATPase subunit